MGILDKMKADGKAATTEKGIETAKAVETARETTLQTEVKPALNQQKTTVAEDAAAIVPGLNDEPEDDRRHMYSTPHSEAFSIQLASGEAKAKDGVLRVNDDQHREIQKLLKSGRPDIAQNVVYLDRASAERIAREHLAKLRPAAHGGMGHSAANAERNERNAGPAPTPLSPNQQQIIDTMANLSEEQRKEAALRAQQSADLKVTEEDATHGDDGALNDQK